jgi:dihydrolipoamide dehydrogenase
MAQSFDVVVIGGGPGGYVAAIRAAQLGLKTACIERWKSPQGDYVLGGTCLNVGCIPSKALLESSENFARLTHDFAAHGIRVDGAAMDVATMLARKDKIVAQFTGGIRGLFRKHKVTWLQGSGRLLAATPSWRIEVRDGETRSEVEASHVVIATGSNSRQLPNVPQDGRLVVDNVGALQFDAVPKRLGVIGAGVIGLELGSVWRRLGAEVTILEALPNFLPAADEAVAKEAMRQFTKEQGFDMRFGAQLTSLAGAGDTVSVNFEQAGQKLALEVDRLIVAVGRVPNTEGLGAAEVGLKLDARGAVEVDEFCRTNLPNCYAVGDVVRGPMLAHKASEEGVMVAERIAGQASHLNLHTIPWVIYTAPEIAWVGQTEQQLREAGVGYRAGSFPFAANGRAQGQGSAAGFVKVLADANNDEILGVHIVHAHASELIAEAVVAMEFKASAEDLARIVHAHPSLSEVLHEAALAVDKRAIHN